jgi:hypothetical protein
MAHSVIITILRERGLVDIGVSKAGPGRKLAVSFIRDYWDYEKSPAIQDKLAHGFPQDITAGLRKFTGAGRKRDILTETETEAIFTIKWTDRRAYIGALLACTSGLRSGEIRVIRREDIGNAVLDVSHSWNDVDGLKPPKMAIPGGFLCSLKYGISFFPCWKNRHIKTRKTVLCFTPTARIDLVPRNYSGVGSGGSAR